MLIVRSYNPEHFNDCIERAWIAENGEEETNIVIPPSQFVDLLFPLTENGFFHNGNHLITSCLEGIMLKPVYLRIPPFSRMMGIRFYGAGFYPFFPTLGKDILNKNIPFPVQKYEKLIHQIFLAKNDSTFLEATNQLLNQMYEPTRDKETQLLKEFYFNLRSNQPYQNIEDFCRETGTNYTSLNRTFSKILGITPKKFDRLIKFRKALDKLVRTPDKLSSIGVDSGYFDQPHFIKEFKFFMDMSPSEYLNLINRKMEHNILKSIDFAFI